MTKIRTGPAAPAAPACTRASTPTAPASRPASASANTPDQPGAGKGMPIRRTQPQTPRPGQHESARSASAENALELPSHRDQAVNMSSEQPNPVIEQAAQDVKDGLKDTSKAPEMHSTYQKQR